ncbi:MAG: hypothetical protein AAB855_02045 [Patescibacteria group bacterium]
MNDKRQKGNVLILAIILGSGMLVAAVEVSMFVVSTMRQARTLDRTLVAFYAAESGVENALHQVRKEGRTTLRNDSLNSPETIYAIDGRDARWTFDGADVVGSPDADKFSSSVQKITKTLLGEHQSLDIHLWKRDGSGLEAQNNQFKTMIVRWQSQSCAPGNTPWIETTGLTFAVSGGTVGWNDVPLKKDFQKPPDDTPNAVTVDLSAFLQSGERLSGKAMTLRVKPFFCALRGLEVSFPKKDTPTELVSIPNYYLIRPTATFGGVRKELQVIMPSHQSATGVFDYTLFSDEKIEKVEE